MEGGDDEKDGINNARGPNDARCVVWAIGEFFYIFFRVFFCTKLMFYSIYRLQTTEYTTWRVATTGIGPNDTSRVVWAIGDFFFVFFYSKLKIYCIYRL